MNIAVQSLETQLDIAETHQLATAWSGAVGHVLYGGARAEQLEPFLDGGLQGEIGRNLIDQNKSRANAGFMICGLWVTQGRKSLLVHVIGRQTRNRGCVGLVAEYWVRWNLVDGPPRIAEIRSRLGGGRDA